ncbi:LuxR C-terminal-related transcriptional regulator [Faecalibacter macacae]|uniref:DNA-binding response regulator n=1 Tax=Faecalibacter macacae TaxID=1859289 RepID=A0A3L9M1V4_9FLAO|nr:response regulator transcription factor [Faecalibacter macacae]RLZ06493.1 DNA-binding response regulator [Faecalibacter macacae]
MKIFILDQHKIVIDGLISLLHRKRDYEVVGYATNISDTINWLKTNKVDLIISEINFHNEDINYFIKSIKSQDIKILILTGDYKIKKISELFKNGINGFIEKETESKYLFEAIKEISLNKSYLSNNLQKKVLTQFSYDYTNNNYTESNILNSITNRELEIIQLICEGCNSKEISDKLFISFNTVETHRKRIFQKLKIKNSISLMRFALRNDIVQ